MGLICIPLVAVYLHIPPPQLSPALQKWHSSGEVFLFRGRKIFYRGEQHVTESMHVVHLSNLPAAPLRLLWCFGELGCGYSPPRLPHLQLRLEQGISTAHIQFMHQSFSVYMNQCLLVQIWDPLTAHFHRVIALDFLGFGFSDKPVRNRPFKLKCPAYLFCCYFLRMLTNGSCPVLKLCRGPTDTLFLSRPV